MPDPNDGIPGQTNAVPQDNSQQQGLASAGVEIQNLLTKRATVDQAINTTLPQALSPIAKQGSATAKMPGALAFNVQQPRMPAAQGSRDAKRQGVAKTIAGVANIVGGLLKAKKESEQRDLAHDIQRVMGAQDSISEASQVLKGDPNNVDAKTVVDKNKQIINDTIGADPKKLKQFEKAFDINFLDPSKNDKDEHGALKLASKSYADQLAAKAPPQLAPNTQAINKIQMLQQQGKVLDDQVKVLAPVYKQEVAEQNKNARTLAEIQGRQNVADTNAQAKELDRNERWKAAELSSKTRYGVAAMQAKSAMDRTMKTIAARQKVVDQIKGTKPEQATKLEAQNAKVMSNQIKDSADTIAKLETIRDGKNVSKEDIEGYNKTINQVKQDQQEATTWLRNYNERTNAKAGGKELISSESEKGGSNNGNTKSTSVPSIGQDEDDSEDDKLIDEDDN